MPTNGGTLNGTNTLYVQYNGNKTYTTRTNTTQGNIPTVTKANSTFSGWYTTANNGNKVIDADGTIQSDVSGWTDENGKWILNNTSNTEGTNKLYARFDIITYTVTFNSNGGTTVATQTVNSGSKATKPTDPTRTNYTFVEWQLNGNTYDFNTPVTSNITLNAIWEENQITLRELLISNGYAITESLVSKFTVGETIESLQNKLGNDVTITTTTSIVSTGTKISKGNESYYIVIKGDISGDGKINSNDLLQMRRYLLEEITLNNPNKKAGMILSTDNIKSIDLLKLRQYLLEEYEIIQ